MFRRCVQCRTGTKSRMTLVALLIAGVAWSASVVSQASSATINAAALQGTWAITSINGRAQPPGEPTVTLTITGGQYQQARGSDVNERGTIQIDASTTPMAVDFLIAEGPGAGTTQLAIIEVSGDTMRASLDMPGAGRRPVEFAAREGAIVLVAQKVKR
jgi:uncharacterized protein (TIGR03067 family)